MLQAKDLAQVLSCEFCEIPKNTFFTEYLQTTASDIFAKRDQQNQYEFSSRELLLFSHGCLGA